MERVGEWKHRDLIIADGTTSTFFLGVLSLVFHSAMHRRPGRPCRPACADRFGRLGNQTAEFLQTIGRIATGVAKPLADYQQIALAGDPSTAFRQQPLPYCFGQAGTRHDWPTQQCLGVHFVDVLSPRPAAAGKGELELPEGDAEMWGDDQHESQQRRNGKTDETLGFRQKENVYRRCQMARFRSATRHKQTSDSLQAALAHPDSVHQHRAPYPAVCTSLSNACFACCNNDG